MGMVIIENNNNILVKIVIEKKNVKKSIFNYYSPNIDCLESENVNKKIRYLDNCKGLATSSSSSAKIYQVMSKGVYLSLKDNLERIEQQSNHCVDNSKQKQTKKNRFYNRE